MRYITEGMTEKLYRVLLDTGDMTSLQRPLAILQHVECPGKKVPKQVQKLQQDTIIGITYFEWEKLVKV